MATIKSKVAAKHDRKIADIQQQLLAARREFQEAKNRETFAAMQNREQFSVYYRGNGNYYVAGVYAKIDDQHIKDCGDCRVWRIDVETAILSGGHIVTPQGARTVTAYDVQWKS